MRYFNLMTGPLLLVEEAGELTGLHFDDGRFSPAHSSFGETALLAEAVSQLDEYFMGSRKNFELPLAPSGTDFQLRCWRALLAVPYGERASYRQVAIAAGSPKAFRAAGGACNRNPIAIIIPCHRITGADGSLVGFGGGLEIKRRLLEHEAKYR